LLKPRQTTPNHFKPVQTSNYIKIQQNSHFQCRIYQRQQQYTNRHIFPSEITIFNEIAQYLILEFDFVGNFCALNQNSTSKMRCEPLMKNRK